MKIKKGKILVIGAVVFDIISGKKFFGGTGANIAYGLGKLKAAPLLFSLVGHDFKKGENFYSHLKKSGVALRVHIDQKSKTASFSCVTNEKEEQIGTWKPNAYKNIHRIALAKKIKTGELKKVSIAIFAPGTAESILKHLKEFKNLAPEALTIFDPGQMIALYSKEQLAGCINLCDIFIVNENEYREAKKILGKDPRQIRGKIIIETRGNKGSIVLDGRVGKIMSILAVKPKQILDTTGAGDAYRVGLIFGLSKGFSLAKSCAIGARLAAKNIACLGCQKY